MCPADENDFMTILTIYKLPSNSGTRLVYTSAKRKI